MRQAENGAERARLVRRRDRGRDRCPNVIGRKAARERARAFHDGRERRRFPFLLRVPLHAVYRLFAPALSLLAVESV